MKTRLTLAAIPCVTVKKLITLALLAATSPIHAGPRTSANYSIAAEAADAGGKRATSTNYTNDGSVGLIVGVSTGAAPAETAKHGYIGQLYEVTALQLTATITTLPTEAAIEVFVVRGGFSSLLC